MKPTDKFDIYELGYTGQVVCEVVIDSGHGGDTVTIGAVPDLHLNLSDITDALDPEVSYTETCRIWCRGGDSLPAAVSALHAASFCDQTVVLGDTLDYISHGSLELTKNHLFKPYPDAICVLGGHDITKQMQTGKPNVTSPEQRYGLLREYWPHDLHYVSKVLKNKVMCIGLDNSLGNYSAYQVELFKADIEKARKEALTVLIFQHENISTRKEADREVNAIHIHNYKPVCNFYDSPKLLGSPADVNTDTLALYGLITESADVIKGVFCGHQHNIFYTEITAKNGFIPQYTLTANPYFKNGTLAKIIVK